MVVNNMERLKRPSSLSKALIPSTPCPATHENTCNNNPILVNKLHQTSSINETNQLAKDYQEPYDSRQKPPNTLQSFNVEDEFKRKKPGIESRQSYYIIKELVMTERTFKKDLDLLTQKFRRFATAKAFDLSEFKLLDQLLYSQTLLPINEFHTKFLKDLELRLYEWSDKSSNKRDNNKIGDLLLSLAHILKVIFFSTFQSLLNEITYSFYC